MIINKILKYQFQMIELISEDSPPKFPIGYIINIYFIINLKICLN